MVELKIIKEYIILKIFIFKQIEYIESNTKNRFLIESLQLDIKKNNVYEILINKVEINNNNRIFNSNYINDFKKIELYNLKANYNKIRKIL